MIELRNVTKEYSKGNAALNGVSVRIERGEFVFIVGDSGSGKSTLIKLLLRELTPTSGTVLVNGQNVAHLKQRQIPKYRRKLGIVFQDFRLLKDRNIYENIAFALRVTETPTRVIKKKVPAALSLVGLAQKYKSFPKELSGGEQQRIAIARIFLKNPPILILDEATSALDSVTEAKIQRAFDALAKGRTTLIIAHRLSTIRSANRIVSISGGLITECGTHQQLLESGGIYAQLYNTQNALALEALRNS